MSTTKRTLIKNAENGLAINVLVEQALAKGHTAPTPRELLEHR